MFKASSFVRKHIESKHPEKIKEIHDKVTHMHMGELQAPDVVDRPLLKKFMITT